MSSKHREPARRRRRLLGLVSAFALLAGIAVAGPPLARRAGFEVNLPWSSSPAACPPTAVELVVTPELVEVVTAVLAPVQGTRQPDGHCLQVAVAAESPADTVRKSQVLPVSRAPQLWIPDSALWEQQTDDWPLKSEGSLATSPLVIATSEAVVAKLGWAARPPTWAQALRGIRPVAMPDLQNNASGALSVLGLWQSLGRTAAADQAVAAAVLASTRSTAPTPTAVVTAAVKNDPATPLLVTSELTVFSTNRGNPSSRLVAVYPQNGSPSLDYPILRVAPHAQGTARSLAVDTVIATLQGPRALEEMRRHGLRDSGGRGPDGAGVNPASVSPLEIPAPAETAAFLTRLQTLTRPSKLTVVVDVSLSMRTLIDGTTSRAQLAGQAAVAVGDLLSDKSSVGLWVFSRDLPDQPTGTHYRQVDALRPLGSSEGGRTHRAVLNGHLATLDEQLGGNGTALYATTLATMKAARQDYDPTAVNSVVLLTDGVNDDPGGIALDELTTQLTALADPAHPIRLIAIGLGPYVDLSVLRTMVRPSNGEAYQATTADELKTVLFDALAHRRPVG